MKLIVTTAALVLAGGVAAGPFTVDKRQFGGQTSNELLQGTCKPVIFLWARGSTEGGNMASLTSAISLFALRAEC
jgi:cutinase